MFIVGAVFATPCPGKSNLTTKSLVESGNFVWPVTHNIFAHNIETKRLKDSLI